MSQKPKDYIIYPQTKKTKSGEVQGMLNSTEKRKCESEYY